MRCSLRIWIPVIGLVALVSAACALVRTPDTDRDEMIAKYGGENPIFATGPDGMKVHYRDEGCRECPVLVLLHGSNASLHTWEGVVEALGGSYRLITYDQPGHGLTGPHPREDYSATGMFEALEAVTEATRVDHFVLGGNSMGGWVSWRYALAKPERVDALILIDAAGAPLRDGERAPPLNLGFRLMRNRFARPLIESVTPRSLVKQSLIESVADPDMATEEVIDRYWELLRFPGNRRATALRASTDREPAYAGRLTEIRSPTLILWGDQDRLIRVSAARTFDERIPDAEVVIFEGVGHIPMEEAPDRTSDAIRSFLESLDGRSSDPAGRDR
jgi:pimeloyl-ACP methyl ester carboxylesterase